jgi:hypothetical protein
MQTLTLTMKWYYESNGLPQGPILENELRRLKEEGKISAECLVWTEGMEDWTPFEKVRDFGIIPKMRVSAEFRLPTLKKETEEAKTEPAANTEPTATGVPTQPTAGEGDPPPERLDGDDALEAKKDAGSLQWAPRWENPGPGGPLLELAHSTVEILFDPARVFQNLRPDGGWGMPLAFLAILNAIGTVMVLWTVQQLPPTGGVLSKVMRLAHQPDLSVAMLVGTLVGGTLLLPLTVVFKAGMLHVLMRLGTPSKAPFATTFRAACYAMGAASALWIVPLGAVWASSFSGHPLVVEAAMLLAAGTTGVWSTFVLLKALACSHRVAMWRAVLAVALPPFLLSVLLGIAFAYAATPL